MAPNPTNPYAPDADRWDVSALHDLDPLVEERVEAVIKDADQFWIAILLCLLCFGFGFLLIGPWYIVRSLQWTSLAKNYPSLRDSSAVPGSLAKRFQKSRWKLLAGMIGGAVLFTGFVLITVKLYLTVMRLTLV